jgi:hypothetical protein
MLKVSKSNLSILSVYYLNFRIKFVQAILNMENQMILTLAGFLFMSQIVNQNIQHLI